MKKLLLSSALLASLVTGAMANDYRVMLQDRDTSSGPPNESFIWNYSSYANLASHTGSAVAWQGDVASNFQTAEFEYDGQYRVILQDRSTAGNPPNESFIWTYNTYADMVNNNGTFESWQINVAPDYQTVGLAYDGQYRVMLQNRSTAGSPPSETFIWTYNTYNDLVNHNGTAVSFQANVSADYLTVGLTYDGQYRMMLQKRDTSGGSTGENFIWTYNTFNDLVNHNGSAEAYQVDVAGSFRTVGLAYEPVPEPATMTALGLGAVALLRRRKK